MTGNISQNSVAERVKRVAGSFGNTNISIRHVSERFVHTNSSFGGLDTSFGYVSEANIYVAYCFEKKFFVDGSFPHVFDHVGNGLF